MAEPAPQPTGLRGRLLGAARTVAEPLRFEGGAFLHAIPPAALARFQSGHADRVYHRVSTGSGQLLAH